MVKPQSSKLITRVRFPSSPRGLGSRRFRVEALFFFPRGDDGNPFRMRICFLARSESARSSSSSPPQIPLKVAGNRFRAKIHSLALSGFSPSSSSSPENYSEQIVRTASTCGLVSSRARNPHAPARHPLHKSRLRLPGIAYGRKCIPSRARDFRPPARHPLENYPERIVRTASACRLVSSRARSPREDSRGLLTFLFLQLSF